MLLRALCLILLVFPVQRSFAQTLTSSNLPIVVIDTNGATIVTEQKSAARMGIIDHGPGGRNAVSDAFNAYDGFIGIEIRGNSTERFDKKSYGFETWTASGEERPFALLGLPRETDWVLSAAYIDKTFIRDPLAFEISRRMGRWASHAIHCELILNGHYQGLYILEERVKRDRGRVDIERIASAGTGAVSTGGYLFQQHGAGTSSERRFVYPRSENITPAQATYVDEYVKAFERALEGAPDTDPVDRYSAWIDVDSFVDEVLIQEMTKNADAYGWSSFFHKPRDGTLRAGPVWDFDQAFSNSIFSDGPNYREWMIERPAHDAVLASNHPRFWRLLFRNRGFRAQVAWRWAALRADTLRTDRLLTFVDDLAARLEEAQARNFERWPILGVAVWRSVPGVEERTTYASEVEYLKTFVVNRVAWMDAALSD